MFSKQYHEAQQHLDNSLLIDPLLQYLTQEN